MIQFDSGSMRVRPVELFSLGDSSTLEPQSGGPYSDTPRRVKSEGKHDPWREGKKRVTTVASLKLD